MRDDFDTRFEKTFDRVMTTHKNVERLAFGGLIVTGVVSFATLGFIGWVVVKLLAHFGVL